MPKTAKRHRTKAQRSNGPRKTKTPAIVQSPAKAPRKPTAGQAAKPPEVKTEAPEQQRDALARFNLFGQFDPQPATGRQRHLFDDGQNVSTSAPWPEKPATGSKTWPRPWAKSTPADARIARQYKAEGTPELF
jgi:hypothetical protein